MASTVYGTVKSAATKAETVASGVSGLAQQARSLVMSSTFNCASGGGGNHDRHDEDEDHDDLVEPSKTRVREMEYESVAAPPRSSIRGRTPPQKDRSASRSNSKTGGRFREYDSRSPHRVDI